MSASAARTSRAMTKGDLLRQFLEARGRHPHPGRMGWQKISCYNEASHPRGDRNPSASVNLVTGHYRCFACGIEGDVYDLVQAEEGVDFPTAKAIVGAEPGTKIKEDTWI